MYCGSRICPRGAGAILKDRFFRSQALDTLRAALKKLVIEETGVIPIGATISKTDVWMRAFGKSPLMHTSTFGGNPLACAAGLAALHVLVDEHLVERSREMGEYLVQQARAIEARHPNVIADVRGRGCVVGVELTSEGYGGVIIPECLKLGMTAAYTLNQQKVIRLEPPLVVTKAEVDEAMSILEQGVAKAEEKLGKL